jgi:methylated-DNA-[protein]-cysteine S-methyltransferase
MVSTTQKTPASTLASTGAPRTRAPALLRERFASPIGEILVVTGDDGRLRGLDWTDHEPRLRRLLQRHCGEAALREVARPTAAGRALEAYFDGDLTVIDALPTATQGTEFQRTVWDALRRIPAGGTLSYQGLAASIGRPTATRAVGLANGSNPIAIVVPCHRVIGADASLTGYAGGVERKRWLLAHEGVTAVAAKQRALPGIADVA